MSEALPRLAIACQGGGAHTAFSAGVLSYLFLAFEHFQRRPAGQMPFRLTGLSGTSGGAITAAMAWSDPGSPSWAEGAQRMLRFWNRNKAGLDPRLLTLAPGRGEVVGAAFDGNIESLGGAFGFDGRVNRTVSVSTAAITEALKNVYGDQTLALELEGRTRR